MIGRAFAALRKFRTLLVMGALIVALAALNFFMGCDLDKDDPKPLYGVPPDGYQQPDVDDPQDLYLDQKNLDDQMRMYYGPMPVDVIDSDTLPPADIDDEVQVRPLYGVQVDTIEEIPDIVAQDQPMAYYGPMPVDILEDSAPTPDDAVQAWYGPPPVDIAESTDAITHDVDEDAASKDAMFYYGPVPYYGSQEVPK